MNNDNPAAAGAGVGPWPGGERIVALDTVRGFALLGILLVNVLGFSGIRALGGEAEGLDGIVSGFIEFFAQGKFLGLFAVLFGIGFTLQLASLRKQDAGIFPTYWRRLAVLFVFGMLHTRLEPTEVLAVYALCGAALIPFRKLPRPAVLLTAIVLMGLPHLHTAIVTPVYVADATAMAVLDRPVDTDIAASGEEMVEPPKPETAATTESEEEEDLHAWDPYLGSRAIKVHSGGTFAAVITYNHQFATRRWTKSWVNYLWMTVPLPLMMFGMLIGRSGILNRIEEERALLKKVFWFGLAAGIVAGTLVFYLYGLAGLSGWNPWVAFPAAWLFGLSGLIMALAYSAGLLLLLQGKIGAKLQLSLAPVGRMALTNYLLQTVICTSLFFGFGLGLYGKVGASQAALIALAIFAAQIVFSRLWLRTFRFGPVEWLWRRATYWKVLPLRKAPD
jgi:uncharacterized protein